MKALLAASLCAGWALHGIEHRARPSLSQSADPDGRAVPGRRAD